MPDVDWPPHVYAPHPKGYALPSMLPSPEPLASVDENYRIRTPSLLLPLKAYTPFAEYFGSCEYYKGQLCEARADDDPPHSHVSTGQ